MKIKKRIVAAVVLASLMVLGAVFETDLTKMADALVSVSCSIVECTQ